MLPVTWNIPQKISVFSKHWPQRKEEEKVPARDDLDVCTLKSFPEITTLLSLVVIYLLKVDIYLLGGLTFDHVVKVSCNLG